MLRRSTLLQLADRAVELQAEADAVIAACGGPGETPGSLPRRIGELLCYHTEMLDLSLTVLERRRHALAGLGEPARALRDSRAALRMWIEEIGPG